MERRQLQETRSPYRKPVTWVQDQVRKETIKFQQLHEHIEQDLFGKKKTKRATRLISDDEYERLKLKPPKNLRQVLNYKSEIERWPEVLKLDQALSPWERQRPIRVLETGYNVATKDIVTVAPRWPESEKHIPGGSPWKPMNVENRKEYSETTPGSDLEVKRWPENKNIPGAIPWDRPTTPSRLARWTRYNTCYYRKYPEENTFPDQYDNDYRYDQDSSFYSTQYMNDFLQFPNFASGEDRPDWESDFPLSKEEFYAVQEIRRKLIEALSNAPVQGDDSEDENEKKEEYAEYAEEDFVQDVEESYDQLASDDPSKSKNKIYPMADEVIEETPKRKKSNSNTYTQAKSVMTVYGDDSFLPKLLVKEDASSNPISPNRSAKKVKQISPSSNIPNSENTVTVNKKPQLFSPERLDPSPPSSNPSQNGRPSSGHSTKRPLSAYSSGSGGHQQRKPVKYDETVFQSPQGKPQPRPPAQANPRSHAAAERPKSAHGIVHPSSKRNEDEISKVPETRMNPRELKQYKEQQQYKNSHPLASPLSKEAELSEEEITNKRRFFLRDDSIVQNLFADANAVPHNPKQQGRNSAPTTRAVTPNTLKNESTPSRPKTAGGRVPTANKPVNKSANSKQAPVIKSMMNNVNQLMQNFSGGDQATAANKAMIIEMATFSAIAERQKENTAPNKTKPTTTLIAAVAGSLASSSAASSSTGFSNPSSKTGPHMSNVTTASSLMTRRETIFRSFATQWYEETLRKEINAIIKKMVASAVKSKFAPTAVSPRGNSKSAVLNEIDNRQKNYMSPIPSFLSELKNNQGLKFQLKKTQNDKNDGNKSKIVNGINKDERNETSRENEEEMKKRKQREEENEESYQKFLGLMKQLHIPHFELNHFSIAKEIPTLSPFQSKSNLFAAEGPLSTPRGRIITSPHSFSSASTTLYYDSVTLLGRGKFASVYCVQNKETVSLESILTPVKLAHQNQSQAFQLRSSAHFTPSTSTAATILLTPPPTTHNPEITSSNKNVAGSSNLLYTPTNHHNLKSQIDINELIAFKVAQFKDNDLVSSDNEKRKKGQANPSKAIVEEFQREILSLYHLQKHDNIINLIGYSLQPFGIVMDYIAGQNLYVLLHNEHWQKSITHHDRLKLLVDISAGLAHIHSRKYIHRDLKPHNIIIEQSESGKALSAKIVDFGTAYPLHCSPQDWKDFYSSNSMKSSNIPPQYEGCHDAIGTSGYTAPELFSDDNENLTINYSYPADIFSMSIILWEMMIEDCSKIVNPLQGINPLVAYEEMKRGRRPPLYQEYHGSPRQYAHLIEESWSFVPHKRLTADGLFFELSRLLRLHDS